MKKLPLLLLFLILFQSCYTLPKTDMQTFQYEIK